MPLSSPGDASAGGIRELGLPARTVTALTRAGVTRTAALALLTRRELAAIDGVGPGAIAAIRAVVPEPPGRVPGTASRRHPLPGMPGAPGSAPAEAEGPAEDEGPASPAIPSFASLRGPWRPAADALVPEPASGSAATGPPASTSASGPAAFPAPPGGVPTGGPRPAEYADLLRLGLAVARAALALPGRVVRWSVSVPGCRRGGRR